MTDLTLFYGTMESGKTTKLLQDNYNYRKHGHKVLIIKPLIDLKGGNTVVNRTNEFAPVDILLANDESIFDDKYLPLIKGTEVILVDEAQFCRKSDIQFFLHIVDDLEIPVICYGLRTDFQQELFEGSMWLLAWADVLEELKTVCWCGQGASCNARYNDKGELVRTGSQIVVGANDKYVSLCRKHYKEGKVFAKK